MFHFLFAFPDKQKSFNTSVFLTFRFPFTETFIKDYEAKFCKAHYDNILIIINCSFSDKIEISAHITHLTTNLMCNYFRLPDRYVF